MGFEGAALRHRRPQSHKGTLLLVTDKDKSRISKSVLTASMKHVTLSPSAPTKSSASMKSSTLMKPPAPEQPWVPSTVV